MKTHSFFAKRTRARTTAICAGAAAILACALSLPASASLTIPTSPLATGTALPPNIMALFDNSGSMAREYMPETNNNAFSDTSGLSTTYIYVSFRTAAFNGMWYNPTVTYTPPTQWDGSSFPSYTITAAVDDGFGSYDGEGTSTVCLVNQATTATSGTPTGWPSGYAGFSVTSTIRSTSSNNFSGFYFKGTSGATGRTSTDMTAGSSTCPSSASGTVATPAFYVYSGTSSSTLSNYTLYEFRLNSSGTLEARKSTAGTSTYTAISDSALGACGYAFCWTTSSGAIIGRTMAQESANLANWHAYYATRVMMARASLSRAFGAIGTNYRVGFSTIWDSNTSMLSIPVTTDSGLFENNTTLGTTNRQTWFTRVFSQNASGGTPLRTALDRIGQYFSSSSSTGPYGPESGSAQVACRQNFTILTTDGYWNDSYSSASEQNAVNTNGTQYTNPNSGATLGYIAQHPFTDNSSSMTTLADVAAYYWKTDLRSDLANTVPADDPTTANLADYTKDPAFWQHMVTFGVSIGAKGTLDPTQNPSTVTWPLPVANDPTAIDDLWHATVVSRGTFIKASDPSTFYNALVAALNRIAQRNGEASNVTANSTSLQTSTNVYQAIYQSSVWTGDLRAYSLVYSASTSSYTLAQQWSAAAQMPAAASRNIYFLSGTTTTSFVWSNLSTSQQTSLGSANVVNYLRGDQTNEQKNGGTLRNRSSILGDIVDSSPAYDSTTNTVYVAANDGFLHAFNASTGVERFAIVPTLLFGQLSVLSTTSYTHQYFFDGDIFIKSVPNSALGKAATATTSGYSQLLVASLGRGGKGLIGVDVSNVSSPKILWEFTNTDLGLPIGSPQISSSNDSSNPWIVLTGNGVNSTNDRAFLFAVNAVTGVLVQKIDTGVGTSNGLINIRGWDVDSNGTVDTVYGGDLKGNLWKFNLSASSGSGWTLTSATPLFQAQDSSGNAQPITGGIALGISTATSTYGKRFVFFGTGSYLTASDSSNLNTQTLYGIIDQGAAVTSRASLRQRTIQTVSTITVNSVTYNVRTVSAAASGDMVGKSGWYLDLLTPPSNTQQGERIVSAPQVISSKVLEVNSIVPLSDPCSPGGTGWLNVVDPYSGGSISTEFFTGFGTSSSIGTSGSPGASAVLNGGNGAVELVTGTSGGQLNLNSGKTGVGSGRISWRELINQ